MSDLNWQKREKAEVSSGARKGVVLRSTVLKNFAAACVSEIEIETEEDFLC